VKKLLIIPVLFLSFTFPPENFFDFKLADINNHEFAFTEFKKSTATVVIFLLSDCPASQSYTLTLNKLSKKYQPDKIAFLGVFPGKYSTDDELKDFKKIYKINFPLVKDPELSFSKHLNAKICPSCFLIDSTGKTIYKGRIDDWLYSIGKKRQIVTQNNLEDAIIAVINKKPVEIPETNAIGCYIEYDK
jgi:peroxiredoxin